VTEVVLIPPTSLLLDTALERRIQMMLPAPLEHRIYRNFYRYCGYSNQKYVILDNGMFEGDALEPTALLDLGHKYNTQEIVLPDIWNSSHSTLDAIRRFFLAIDPNDGMFLDWRPRLTAVVHGPTMFDAQQFVGHIYESCPLVTTISISRSLTRSTKQVSDRIRLASWIKEQFPDKRYDIHLLGLDDSWHRELWSGAKLARSLDTVAPFTAAFWGVSLDMAELVDIPRPKNYFDLPSSEFPVNLVRDNIAYLDNMAEEE
jgi:hypothetical protein